MKTIRPLTFSPVKLRNVEPTGWFRKQLEIQAEGMTGKLDEFWTDVKDSAWFGGDGEGWERAPYWLDGMMPLAYLLKDEKLISKVQHYMNHILENQQEDGWLGPLDSNVSNPEAKAHYDIWAQFLALKMLVQYEEITGDDRVENAVRKGLMKINQTINWTPLFDWGQARWFEAIIAILWLYERQPEKWLLDLVSKLEAQGFGWKSFFENWVMVNATEKGGWNFMSHVVNNAMAIKAYALMSRVKNDPELQSTVDHMIEMLDEYHGTAVGTFTGDECLAGKEPTRGTELCSIVEYMYSLEHLVQIFGDVRYSDRLEKIAYNALPAAFTRDMWAHQYNQQTNQIQCAVDENMPWCTNDPDANIYGLEPHFGCCTSNYHQGFPKYLANQWMNTNDGGIVATVYAPSKLQTTINNISTSIEIVTDYPFTNRVVFVVETECPTQFPLHIRVPEWAPSATITIGDDVIVTNAGGYYHSVDRAWSGRVEVVVEIDMVIEVQERLHNCISLQRGPLVYSLPVSSNQTQINQHLPMREFPHCDYEFHPTSPWNYALENGNFDACIYREHGVDNSTPFSDVSYPTTLNISAKLISEWTVDRCIAGVPPLSPIESSSDTQSIELVPFGCTHLRITEFPYWNK